MSNRMRWNILAVWMGFFLSIALYGWLTKYTNLSANIRWSVWVSNQIITDLVVQVDWENNLTITAWKMIPSVDTMSILVIYDPEVIYPEEGNIESPYDYSLSQWVVWEYTVFIELWWETLLKSQNILTIPSASSPWTPYDMIIADVLVTFEDWTAQSLSLTLP